MLPESKELVLIHILEVWVSINHWIQGKEQWVWLVKHKQERRQALFLK
jgi:hypothetical protein